MTEPDVAALHRDLDARATEKSRAFWSKYLKGDAEFRGVPMGEVRAAVHAWWGAQDLDAARPTAQKAAALRLFEGRYTEDKLAGTLALSELLLPHLTRRDLPAFARLFAEGHIADWNVCDWFCVKVLSKMLDAAEAPAELGAAIGAWRDAEPLWQRRSSCVAFVNHVPQGDALFEGLTDHVLDNATRLVRDPARFAQTGVGWTLRELSKAAPARVLAFADAHLAELSREAVKSLTAKLPEADRRRVLAEHRRVARAARSAR